MRYHLTLVRMAIIKKSTNNKCWRWCVEKVRLLHCWWECKLIQSLQKIIWTFLKKLGIKPPYDPAIPLLGICPEKNNRIKKWEKDLNRCFSKEDIQMVNKYMKRCSTSLIIRAMQIESTMRYHLTLIRMAITKKSANNKYHGGCGERECALLVGISPYQLISL